MTDNQIYKLIIDSDHDDPSHDEGVITLADSSFFAGFVLLYESIQKSYPVPVICFDGGLSAAQKQWITENLQNCTVRPIPDIPETRTIISTLNEMSPNGTPESMLWICPFLIASSPFQRVLWLDSDLIVVEDLGYLFGLIDKGPVFTLENNDQSDTPNKPLLYSEMPVSEDYPVSEPLINAGVSGWDLVRDAELLQNYMEPVIEACRSETVRQSISWHDQGCLIWAVQKSGLQDYVLEDINWNLCAKHFKKEMSNSIHQDLYLELRDCYPGAKIVHWNGFKVHEKLFSLLGNEEQVASSVLSRMPGPSHRAEIEIMPLHLKLISHISSETSTILLSNFIKHYLAKGVDDFLIILHKIGGKSSDIEDLLSGFGIKPVLEVEDYSAELKAHRVEKIKAEHVIANDWVIYADVDELQVYPGRLDDILLECEQQGYVSLAGQLVDRIAENGELREITQNPSIWEQFPYRANVTSSITGGWTRKICVAKGSIPINYSGAHHRSYGCGHQREYKATYSDISNYPEPVEIHHFKWDASLAHRLDRKLNSTGGDRDAIDGKSFIAEYQSLYSHISKNKRINVISPIHAGIPNIDRDS